MPWPTPQEYNEAIQNPAQNFADAELAGGTVETTALGLPRPITGNFASVYRMRCGGRDWAVRCFWREFADMRERYAAISAHLRSHPLPYTVGFEYLPHGIKVRGAWYPVLKMEWIEGELLGQYIERHLADAAVLTRLADRWREMVLALEAAGVAHGDLQHGNVLVVNGALRLVDYDALYVPALRGRGSHELGHQHYQHPGRTERDFGPRLDRFSALVIECSLRAVARQPDLWTTLQAGDESLLFRRADFADPGSSPAFRLLLAQPDAEVSRLAGLLRTALGSGPMDAPALARPEPPLPTGRRTPAPLRALLAGAFPGIGIAPAAAPAAGSAPGWLADHLPARQHPRPSARVRQGAAAAALLGAGWLVIGLLTGFAAMGVAVGSAAGMGGAAAILLAAFHGEGEVRAMKQTLRQERRQRRELAALEREIERYTRRLAALQDGHGKRELRARERLRHLSERKRCDRELAAELLREAGARAEELRAALDRDEREQVRSAVEALQRRYVRSRLRCYPVRSAPLPVVARLRLWLAGIRTAADVDIDRMATIRRLGEDVTGLVAAWRVDAELEARKGAPNVLPAPMLHRLTERFGRERTRIDRDRQRALDRHKLDEGAIAAYWTARRRPIEERLAREEAALRAARHDLDGAVAEVRRRAEPLQVQLARTHRDLEPYSGLSFGRYLAGAVTGRSSLLP